MGDFGKRHVGRELGQGHASLIDFQHSEIGDQHVDQPLLVSGMVHWRVIFFASLELWSITRITFSTPATRSMAPPIPGCLQDSEFYVPQHPGTPCSISPGARHAWQRSAAFTPNFGNAITADEVYKVVLAYAAQAGIAIDGFGVHSLRATAATNPLEHEADIAKVQEWLTEGSAAIPQLQCCNQLLACRHADLPRHLVPLPPDNPTVE
ncbi:hypothetical protein [Paraburkholderia elongata]|uniref:hypothetical protein n=1 Tax=Paraburkholderia elongata TaxID=2675747 RepID=UPI001C13098D|nr:hypothetical protein [Paraburkholderia elongata]